MDLLNSQQERNTTDAFSPISPTTDNHLLSQTTTEDRRETSCKWNPTEDVVLVSAWSNISKGHIVGNERKVFAFSKRIAAYYSSRPAVANLPKRECSNCKQRWHKINDSICKFVGCYDHALNQRTSGQYEDDVVQVAYQFYYNNYKSNFTLEHAWRELQNYQKWCSSNISQSSKGIASTNGTKLDEGGLYSSSYNTESNVDEQYMAHYVGLKASKRKGKNVVTKTTVEKRDANSQLRLENLWALKEKDITERNKLSMMELLRSFLGK